MKQGRDTYVESLTGQRQDNFNALKPTTGAFRNACIFPLICVQQQICRNEVIKRQFISINHEKIQSRHAREHHEWATIGFGFTSVA